MQILRVALNSPLKRLFDYLPPDGDLSYTFRPGQRLRVPFGKNSVRTGLIISLSDKTEVAKHKLKKALALLDEQPIIDEELLYLISWTSRYYHHDIGNTAFMSMPALLRQGKPAVAKQTKHWRLTQQGLLISDELKRAPKQLAIVNFIKQYPNGVQQQEISHAFQNSKTISNTLNALLKKQLIESQQITLTEPPYTTKGNNDTANFTLSNEQQYAIDRITNTSNTYQTYLLNGITGSGKTEVYIQLIQHSLNDGKQTLILVPEISLTTQTIRLITNRFKESIVVLHSGLSPYMKLSGWLKARDGSATIVIGTRSAIWTPMPKLGIIIIDEEHDLSYKQQDGLRYSARDLALIRGKKRKISVILGSATPSIESIKNVKDGRYQQLQLSHRIPNSKLPDIKIHDINKAKMYGAISDYLFRNIAQRLANGQQTLLFLNRRGYSPIIMCRDCNFMFRCPHCDKHMTLHKHKNRLSCHYCGYNHILPATCPNCMQPQLIEIGHGTERLEETLTELIPKASILRIDRDTTRHKNSMQRMLHNINTGNADILIGTQMLTKGHHFPNVTLVGIINADQALFNMDYRASERMAQIFVQVSGRAGRNDIPGTVIVQTHYPQHPLLTKLAKHDYQTFAELLLTERQQAKLPPFSFHALLRSESKQQKNAQQFLNIAKIELQKIATKKLDIYGPIPAPMEKRANRYRFQLLIQATYRKDIKTTLTPWLAVLEQLPEAKKTIWSIDIDPQDML